MIGLGAAAVETPGWRECSEAAIVVRSSAVKRRSWSANRRLAWAQPRTVERVAHTARVGEVRLADASGQVLFKGLARAGSETVAVLLEELIAMRSSSAGA